MILPHTDSGMPWRKSKRSQDEGACVELQDRAERVGVRDSKNIRQPGLELDRRAFAALALRIKHEAGAS